VKQHDNHNKLQGDFWDTESMVFKECQRFINGINKYKASYESAHVADPMFLSKVMYYYNLTLSYHLHDECLVQEDFMAIRWELADLQKCHTKGLQGQFFQSLPQVLQAQTSKKCEIDQISEPALYSITPKGKEKGPLLPNPDQQSAMKLQPNENLNDIILRTQQMKLVPVWPGTKKSVCLNWHINGRRQEKCEHKDSHKPLDDRTLKQMGAFLKACRAAHKKVLNNKE
jgi:hypothetical protein